MLSRGSGRFYLTSNAATQRQLARLFSNKLKKFADRGLVLLRPVMRDGPNYRNQPQYTELLISNHSFDRKETVRIF
jgi:hypothetical protein